MSAKTRCDICGEIIDRMMQQAAAEPGRSTKNWGLKYRGIKIEIHGFKDGIPADLCDRCGCDIIDFFSDDWNGPRER